MLGQQYLGHLAASNAIQLAGDVQQQIDRIILHISQSDRAQFTRALDYTERFLREHESSGNEIEVVAHAGGLDLMRDDVSPLRERILALMQQHDNVHCIACASAIAMLRDEGIEPVIIKGVGTDTTAFDHIVDRLQGGGWKYLKVEALPAV